MPNYTYRALWDVGRGEYVAPCLEFPREEQWGSTACEAIAAMEQAVEAQLRERAEFGLDPPESLSDRTYSGTFMVRTSTMLHRRMTIEAAEQGVSMNQWIVSKLSDRPIKLGFDDLFD